MKFVPVPGTKVLFSIWDTRVTDYEKYAAANPGVTGAWKSQQKDSLPVILEPDHPVVRLNRDAAQAFCAWLTAKEIAEGKLAAGQRYRLPRDAEWSLAAGLSEEEGLQPYQKALKNQVDFPWGKDWPPKDKTGNFADETLHAEIPSDTQKYPWINGYTDGYGTTSPVGSFPANAYGLYDMAGNVWQHCEDMHDADSKALETSQNYVTRGGAWDTKDSSNLLSSYRRPMDRRKAAPNTGFRCVLELAPSTAATPPTLPVSPASQPSASAPDWAAIPELKALHDQFVKLTAERVTAPFEAEVAKLNAGYLGGLDLEIANEKKAGHLDGVIALEAEKKLIQGMGASGPQSSGAPEAPAPCPIPAEDDEKTVEALKKLRGIYREAYAKIEAARAANLKGLTDPLIVRLKQLVADLTRQDRVADAKSVREYREALEAGNAGRLAGNLNAGGETATMNEADKSASALPAATKDKPFTNSLGMQFVPVKGTEVMFCIHETRYKDYAAYANEVPSVDDSWKDQTSDGHALTDNKENHPVMKVSWEDAQKFCAWLSNKEGKTYRLPTDQEWSYAVGLERDEKWKKDTTPATVQKNQTEFPWGDKWPPPKGSGNYSDDSRKAKEPNAAVQYLENYDDGFPTTAPVMSFKPNKLGLYDLDGNVREWVDDWYDNAKKDRVSRGGCWNSGERTNLLSSLRTRAPPGGRFDRNGFRCVLVVSGG